MKLKFNRIFLLDGKTKIVKNLFRNLFVLFLLRALRAANSKYFLIKKLFCLQRIFGTFYKCSLVVLCFILTLKKRREKVFKSFSFVLNFFEESLRVIRYYKYMKVHPERVLYDYFLLAEH